MQTFTPHPCAQYLLTGQLCLSYLSPLLILTLLENPMFFSPCYSILEKDWMLEKLHFLVKVHQIARRQEDSPQTWPAQSCEQCLSTVTLLVSAGPSFFLFFFFVKLQVAILFLHEHSRMKVQPFVWISVNIAFYLGMWWGTHLKVSPSWKQCESVD